jgi:hypothetical protein
MSRLTIGFGVVLVLIGVAGYVASGSVSVTALIPAFIGVPMAVVGWMMGHPNLHAAGLYSAIALAVIMALGSLRGVAGLLVGDFSEPALIQLVLFLASIGFVVFAAREVFAGRRGGSRPMGA